MFLITLSDPLNLTMQLKIENESWISLGMAEIVYMDPDGTFRAITQEIPGGHIDLGRAGNYVAKVRIKESNDKMEQGLPWDLPSQLKEDLVANVVSCLRHMMHHSTKQEHVSMRTYSNQL